MPMDAATSGTLSTMALSRPSSDHDHVLPPDIGVQPSGEHLENVGVLQGRNRQQDADEEHDRAHVDPRQRVNQGKALLFVLFLVAVDQFADQPENAEAKQDPHERRQVGDRLEGRHQHQNAEPEKEHQIALERRWFASDLALAVGRRNDLLAPSAGS